MEYRCRLTAILFIDIAGYSSLMQKDEINVFIQIRQSKDNLRNQAAQFRE